MAVKTYQHARGRLVSEKTTGGSRKDYLTDALGSVTCVTDTSGNTLETIRNAAYGKRVSGAAPTVARTWAGTWGYAQTGLAWADVSLPYRHYSSQTTRWTTADPLWPVEQAYGYAFANPVLSRDRTGMKVTPIGCDGSGAGRFAEACDKLAQCLANKPAGCKGRLLDCIAGNKGNTGYREWIEQLLAAMLSLCKDEIRNACVVCDLNQLPKECSDLCAKKGTLASTVVWEVVKDLFSAPDDPNLRGDDKGTVKCHAGTAVQDCHFRLIALPKLRDCSCVTILCKGGKTKASTFVHELGHCTGVRGSGSHDKGVDVIYRLGNCYDKVIK